MKVQHASFANSDTELEEMRELLIRSYAADHRPFNWRLSLFENWYFASQYLEPPEYFTNRAQLWRNEQGRLVGFIIRYYSSTHLQILPDHRFLEEEMLAWAERHWSGEKQCLQTHAFQHDRYRQSLLAQRGYKDRGVSAYIRVYDLQKEIPSPTLPPGFKIISMAENASTAERIDLENKIWGRTDMDEAWFAGKSSAPTYSSDWDLVVVSPEGKQVASCLVWVYEQTQSAEIEPLGTHPNFRRMGIARAMVLETMRRLKACGIRYLYIGSDPDPDYSANHLYASLDPAEMYLERVYVKNLS